jgi:hypothetical protein
LDVRNWATAKERPVTRAAGHTSRRPRLPSTTSRSRSGTTMASRGAWRPTIAPIVLSGIPVSVAAVVIGMAIAPKATGAVLASSTVHAARSGATPRAMSMVAVMATGAPKPASASSRPPKQKAMRTAWMRGSSLTMLNVARRSSNLPLVTVSW